MEYVKDPKMIEIKSFEIIQGVRVKPLAPSRRSKLLSHNAHGFI